MTTTNALNEVDLEAVGGLAQAIVESPITAATTWKATVEWDGGFRSVARIRDFAPIPSDEPPALGGTDTAPNPVEQVIAALGNCLAVGYAAGASAAGIEIKDLRIDLEGDLDLHAFLGLRDGHAGYDDLRVSVHLDTDADRAAVEALHAKVVGTSPVGHTLSRAIPLSIDLA
ncbi:MAG TPA: OsmC family protein [Acidimicrobiia bacterium]|jgi:uncharacterized OsmC-like protein